MSTAERVIVTNEGTEQYYHHRYEQKIHTAIVHNAVFPETYDDRRTTFSPQSPYTILFTGHVYWAQEQAVLNLIQAMDKVQDLPVKLDLYIPKANEIITAAVAGKNNIRITAAPQSEMPRVQSEATLLFLPLAWNTKAPDIIATATPGKFTDYLASGRPMLVHAPDYAYVSQYTKQHELGIVVDTNSVEQLATAIRNYLKNPSDGQRYVDNALRVFHENHDARKNAQKLTELLNMV
jgi:glycosyltransferase involved in cell wall biosynthesis